jgi:hypothetical protein
VHELATADLERVGLSQQTWNMTQRAALSRYVVAVLVAEYRASDSATLRSIDKWGIKRSIAAEIVINTENKLDYFTFIELLKSRHPNKHLIIMHDDIFLARISLPGCSSKSRL